MKHKKKTVAEKVRDKIDFLRSPDGAEVENPPGAETLKNLELLLENFVLARDRAEALHSELRMAKANATIAKDELRALFKGTKKILKKQKTKQKRRKKGG